MPWLLDEAEKTLDKKILARALLDGESRLSVIEFQKLRRCFYIIIHQAFGIAVLLSCVRTGNARA